MKNEETNKMKFNIQLFADTADNSSSDDSGVNVDNAGDDELEFTDGAPNGDTVVEDKKITTKAFSERLNREKEKLKQDFERNKAEELNKIAVKRGFKNWEELEDFDRKEKIENMGITDIDTFQSVIKDAISKDPIVLEAKKIIESQKKKEQDDAINSAIQEISTIDSSIKSIDDLLALDNYDEFYGLVEKGYTLVDAYKISNFDKISTKKAASAAQDVLTKIDSKNHIKPIKGSASKDAIVPEEVLEAYKKNIPNMTEDEIRKHYNSFIGGEK